MSSVPPFSPQPARAVAAGRPRTSAGRQTLGAVARLWWSIGLIVALGTGAASGVLLGFEAAPKEQAKKIEELLKDSTKALNSLRAALSSPNPCQQSGVFRDVLRMRQNELKTARTLNVDRLQSRNVIKMNLTTALQHSVAADQAYVDWAAQGCRSTAAQRYQDGNAASVQASAAKTVFMKNWKPIALKYGLTTTYDF